eukprot:1151553-Pelagomonas_calceolata.AAC.1
MAGGVGGLPVWPVSAVYGEVGLCWDVDKSLVRSVNCRDRQGGLVTSEAASSVFVSVVGCGARKEKKRKEKLRRQRKLSLHQLRKRRHIGSEEQ